MKAIRKFLSLSELVIQQLNAQVLLTSCLELVHTELAIKTYVIPIEPAY